MWQFFVAIALAAALGGCGVSGEYVVGDELYERSCVACHASDGGAGIGPAIGRGSNTDINLSDEQIAGVITIGPGNMPGFSRFTQEQVESLVAYVRSFSE
jgi:mono/diheme cytochrome c family protein